MGGCLGSRAVTQHAGEQWGPILRIAFVGGEQLADHCVVAGVGLERLHDPVGILPHVLLTAAVLIPQAPPVGIPPDTHPMAAPAFTMPRVREQLLDEVVAPVRGRVGLDRCQFFWLWGETDQVHEQPTDEHMRWYFRLRPQPGLLLSCCQEDIDRVANISRMVDLWHDVLIPWPVGPVLAWIGSGLSSVGAGQPAATHSRSIVTDSAERALPSPSGGMRDGGARSLTRLERWSFFGTLGRSHRPNPQRPIASGDGIEPGLRSRLKPPWQE